MVEDVVGIVCDDEVSNDSGELGLGIADVAGAVGAEPERMIGGEIVNDAGSEGKDIDKRRVSVVLVPLWLCSLQRLDTSLKHTAR